MNQGIWDAWGSVWGGCGHRHRSYHAAYRCATRHLRRVAQYTNGGVSDRLPRPLDATAWRIEMRMRKTMNAMDAYAQWGNPPEDDDVGGGPYIDENDVLRIPSAHSETAWDAWWEIARVPSAAVHRRDAWNAEVLATERVFVVAEDVTVKRAVRAWLTEARERACVWTRRAKGGLAL